MNNVSKDLGRALDLMETALGLIDRADQAPDVGAHLDLAVQRLKQFLRCER